MIPSTLVRRPRGPFTFVGLTSFFLDRLERERDTKAAEGCRTPRRSRVHQCVATLDDGRICGLPAHCVDMQRGGFVCDEHRPVRTAECGLRS